MRHVESIHPLDANQITSMSEETPTSPDRGPVDTELRDRIAAHLARSDRFDDIRTRPTYAPNAVVAEYNLGYFPNGITRAYL